MSYIYTYTDYIVTLTHLKHHPSDHQVVGPMPAGGLSDFFPVPAARLGVEKLRHRRCSNEYNWGYSILWGCIKTYIPIFGKMNIHESQLFLGKGARVLTHSHKITGGDGLWFLPTNWNMELPSGSWEIDLWRMFHIDFDLLESSICMYLLYIDTFHELDANFLWFGVWRLLRFGLSNLDTFGRTPLPQHYETCSSFNIPGTNHGSHFPSSVRLRVKLVNST